MTGTSKVIVAVLTVTLLWELATGKVAALIETVTVPGVTPEEGVTFNQLAFEVTEKLPVALLSIRND